MAIELHICQESYYIRGTGSGQALRWSREGETWVKTREEVPAEARRVRVGELPADLQEEVLAFMARAASMGNQIWNMAN